MSKFIIILGQLRLSSWANLSAQWVNYGLGEVKNVSLGSKKAFLGCKKPSLGSKTPFLSTRSLVRDLRGRF
jgi:hypothetical protein